MELKVRIFVYIVGIQRRIKFLRPGEVRGIFIKEKGFKLTFKKKWNKSEQIKGIEKSLGSLLDSIKVSK